MYRQKYTDPFCSEGLERKGKITSSTSRFEQITRKRQGEKGLSLQHR